MQIEKTDWSKYSDESIDFILSQSEKTMNETIVSYRENTNKSYAALAIFSGLLSYCVANIVNKDDGLLYFLLFGVGLLICIVIVFVNLTPKNMWFIGSSKSLLCQDYYENEVSKENQLNAYKIQTIETYDESIKDNMKQITRQVNAFKKSVLVFLGTVLATLLTFLVLLFIR